MHTQKINDNELNDREFIFLNQSNNPYTMFLAHVEKIKMVLSERIHVL